MTDVAKDIGLKMTLLQILLVNLIFAKINYILFLVAQLWEFLQIKPFIKTRLISPIGKLRAGLDLFKTDRN